MKLQNKNTSTIFWMSLLSRAIWISTKLSQTIAKLKSKLSISQQFIILSGDNSIH
jgi:hypothetical protein